jgi:hypothetical protein
VQKLCDLNSHCILGVYNGESHWGYSPDFIVLVVFSCRGVVLSMYNTSDNFDISISITSGDTSDIAECEATKSIKLIVVMIYIFPRLVVKPILIL